LQPSDSRSSSARAVVSLAPGLLPRRSRVRRLRARPRTRRRGRRSRPAGLVTGSRGTGHSLEKETGLPGCWVVLASCRGHTPRRGRRTSPVLLAVSPPAAFAVGWAARPSGSSPFRGWLLHGPSLACLRIAARVSANVARLASGLPGW